MGIYTELQESLSEAFNSDLLDAYKTVIFTEYGDTVYDHDTGISTPVENNYNVKCIKLKSLVGEVVDKATSDDFSQFLVLDSDKIESLIPNFEIDQKITDGDDEYVVSGIDIDPVKATYIIDARRFA